MIANWSRWRGSGSNNIPSVPRYSHNAAFLGNLRTIHSAAENRMLTLVAIARSGGTGEDDADDASLEKP